jgi:ABC-type antimicrobial peptide transport system permease subunit
MLAMLGVYGVLSFTLARQRREIGIRIALGADNRSVARLVLVRGVALAGAGIVIGVLAALSMSRVIQAVLTGVDATDPTTYGVVISLLGVVTLAACISPAVRATRVDPRDALASD